jgi:TRAP-type C4-dicarboxylate transport system substrate-binding protein
MSLAGRNFIAHLETALCTLLVVLTLDGAGPLAPYVRTAAAQNQTYTMKISLPTLNDPSYFYAKDYAAALEKDSGGRIKAQIFPASQLGSIPRQIEGTQFGSIQCALIPPEFFVGVDDRFEVMAAPGLVSSLAQGQRVAADPQVRKLMLGLGANKGLHGVAMYMNSPSSVVAAWRDPGSDDPSRRHPGNAAGRHRRRGWRHRGVDSDALSGRLKIRHRNRSARGFRHG